MIEKLYTHPGMVQKAHISLKYRSSRSKYNYSIGEVNLQVSPIIAALLEGISLLNRINTPFDTWIILQIPFSPYMPITTFSGKTSKTFTNVY